MTDHEHEGGCCGGSCARSEGLVLVEVKEGVALVTLNRPDKLNALSAEMLGDLFVALADIDGDDEVAAIVITGSTNCKRPSFAAGADIAEMVEFSGLEMREHARLGQRTFAILESMSKPSIAAVNGFAFGGGCELAMACHVRFAAEGALLGQPEINLGIIPGFGGSQRLPRLVGQGRALEMLLSGDPVSATEAHRIGLVNKVFPTAELLPAAMEFAKKLAGKAPVARHAIVDAVLRGAEIGADKAQALEADLFGLVGSSDDVKEGMKAYLEKRAAHWTGR
ncbi:MAG: hypothetical protein EXS14_08915 [Planctomycetes bacterium]|nr:hypothetical protein [Planctomycetota bacterium]